MHQQKILKADQQQQMMSVLFRLLLYPAVGRVTFTFSVSRIEPHANFGVGGSLLPVADGTIRSAATKKQQWWYGAGMHVRGEEHVLL